MYLFSSLLRWSCWWQGFSSIENFRFNNIPTYYIVVLYANDFKKCKLRLTSTRFLMPFCLYFIPYTIRFDCKFPDQNIKETLGKKNAGEDGARALRKKCVMHIHKRTSASNATWHITSSEFYLSATIPQWGFKDY